MAEGLRVGWNNANDAVLAEGKGVLIDDVDRFEPVKVVGVDEHVWRHTRRGDQGDRYVTVIVDLTSIRDGTGPARLLDMVQGPSKRAFKTWLADRDAAWRDDAVEVVAMDGFTGFKTATTEELPDAIPVLDPCARSLPRGPPRRRRPRPVPASGPAGHPGHRGCKNDPLYSARRTLHTGAGQLDKQIGRLNTLFADDQHVEVEATRGIYQQMIAAYRDEDRRRGRDLMVNLTDSISADVSTSLTEVITLGRTLKKRASDVLAYFDRPGISDGPPRRSTAVSNTSADPHSASAT